MTTKREQYDLLLKAAENGEHVRLVNRADVDMDGGNIQIHVHGKLTYDDSDQEFSVITQDRNGHGTNSVSFKSYHLDFTGGDGVFRQPSGILEITTK